MVSPRCGRLGVRVVTAALVSLLAFLAVSCGGGDEAAPWRVQTLGRWFSDIAFLDAQQGWAAGVTGIFTTSDGGASWRRLAKGKLTAVCALDPEHVWAVGEDGAIVGGPEMRAQTSGTRRDLRGVAFADAQTGWAVGAKGTILATSDGGATWRSQRSPTTGSLGAVACVDAERAWVAGSDGIYATDDGGEHWRRQLGGAYCGDITFLDARRGWAVGDAIYATIDGGEHWQGRAIPENPEGRSAPDSVDLASVAFPDADHGWAVGSEYWLEGGPDGAPAMEFLIVHTEDGGATWRAQPVEALPQPEEWLPEAGDVDAFRVLSGVSFADRLHGWAVGCGWRAVTFVYRPE